MAIKARDTFSSGSALESHTDDLGNSWAKANGQTGNATISSGKLTHTAGAATNVLYANSATPASPDYTVRTKIRRTGSIPSEVAGITGRCDTAQSSIPTCYMARLNDSSWELYLFKQDAGGAGVHYLLLGGPVAATLTADQDYVLELVLAGTSLTVKVDGSTVVGPITNSALAAAGKGGVIFYSPGSANLVLDDFEVEDGSAAGPSLAAGTVTATPTSPTAIDLSTTAASGGTSPYSYQFQSSLDGSTGWTDVGTGSTSTTATHTATAGVAYYYRCVVTDDATDTATSAVVGPTRYPTTFHFATAGDDSTGDGTSGDPWATIAKANTLTLVPGDSARFNGGDTFSGSLQVDGSGTAALPITVGSYGTGAATIDCGDSYGVWLDDAEYVTVDGLTVTGSGVSSAGATTSTEAAIKATLAGSADRSGIVVRNCTVSGSFYGILLEVAEGNSHSFLRPMIVGNAVDECGFAGIAGWQVSTPLGYATTRRFADPYIARNTVSDIYGVDDTARAAEGRWEVNITSGFGVMGYTFTDGQVEHNLIRRCGQASSMAATGGPTGILFVECTGSVARCNEVHHIYDPHGVDGEGIDTDLGAESCIVERNYVHHCDGPAFFDYSTPGNTFRWNIAANNGLRTNGSSAANAATGVSFEATNTIVHNNIFYHDKSLGGAAGTFTGSSGSGVVIRDNLIVATGTGATFGTLPSGVTLQGNRYHATGGATFSLTYDSAEYTSLAALRAVAETLSGEPVGSTGDPGLSDPGNGGTDHPIGELHLSVTAYDPTGAAPTAPDLLTAFGVDPGPADFHGGAVRDGSGYPAGAVLAATPTLGGGAGNTYSRGRLVNGGGI